MVNEEQRALTEELAHAAELYYNGGNPVMSDLEYDRKLERLKDLEDLSGHVLDNSPTVHVGAKVVDSLVKERHKIPALSLDKKKYANREELCSWLGSREGILSWKMDGLTIVLSYKDGKLVKAVTRGDGYEGSVITHNAVFFEGIPLTIKEQGELIVRGEAVMSFSEFRRINEESDDTYENPRNLASATIQMLDANESRKRKIRFFAFEIAFSDVEIRNQKDRFAYLSEMNFNVVEHYLVNKDNLLDVIDFMKDKIEINDYPTDGLVLSYNDQIYGASLGNTEHHPRHSIALKWTDEVIESEVIDIEWSVGSTGAITPVAIFKPVRLGLGSTVTRASLHNISIMNNVPELGSENNHVTCGIGSTVGVYLANMIIPQIAYATPGIVEIPDKCPVCGEKTELRITQKGSKTETLYCSNSKCPARQIRLLMKTFSKDGLFVRGLGESQLKDLISVGLVKSALDMYKLKDEATSDSVKKLLKKDGWGNKKWRNLLDAIEQSKNTTLQKFLFSLNIPLVGNDLSKKLAAYWNDDVKNFRDFLERKSFSELASIDGVGEEKVKNIAEWVNTFDGLEEINSLIGELSFQNVNNNISSSLVGLTFVITGAVHHFANRDELKALIEKCGGKVAGSVSKNTTALINNDISSTSGKNKKAKELGIEIISEDDFLNKYFA